MALSPITGERVFAQLGLETSKAQADGSVTRFRHEF